jgi:hypothetical protein
MLMARELNKIREFCFDNIEDSTIYFLINERIRKPFI